MILGILGVGHLAATLVAGFLRSGLDPQALLLSPRGKARDLSARHGIPLAADNADLVARSSIVILTTRPADAPAAVAGLPWREGQIVISACAGVPLSRLAVQPAQGVRAMPLTAAEIGASPTVCFPPLQEAVAVLERLGPVIPLGGEDEFEAATVNAAVYGWALSLIRRSAEWMAGKGPDAQAMRKLAALTFTAAGRMIVEKQEPMEDLLGELVTPGGITELGLGVLAEGGVPECWDAASQAVYDRLMARNAQPRGEGG